MVRAMLSREEDFKIFFENNVVAVGWSRIDFSSFSDVDELKKAVRGAYYAQKDKAPHVISKNLNEVERFKQMQKGDRVIVPFYSYIVLAEMEDQEIYSKKAFPQDLSNQRRVSYRYENGKILKIPRNELSEGLQRQLRVRGNTVSDLLEFKEEIERIFQRKSYSYSQEMRDIEQKKLEKLVLQKLSFKIRNYQNLSKINFLPQKNTCILWLKRVLQRDLITKSQLNIRKDLIMS